MNISRNMEAIFIASLAISLVGTQFSSTAHAQVMRSKPASSNVIVATPANTTINTSAPVASRQTVVIHANRLSH